MCICVLLKGGGAMNNQWDDIINNLSIEDAKGLLLRLARELFLTLDADEKRQFIVEMVGQTGTDRIGSMVQL